MESASFKFIENRVADQLSIVRFKHSLNVAHVAHQLAKHHGASADHAAIAGLLHDIAREYSDAELLTIAESLKMVLSPVERAIPMLLHGIIGAHIAKINFEISETSILSAIMFHVTGKANMTLLEKILFIADYTEPLRRFPEVNLVRKISFQDIDKAVILAIDSSLDYLLKDKKVIHEDSIRCRNDYLLKLGDPNFD